MIPKFSILELIGKPPLTVNFSCENEQLIEMAPLHPEGEQPDIEVLAYALGKLISTTVPLGMALVVPNLTI